MDDPLNMRVEAVLVLDMIDGLEKYLDITEAHMEEVWHIQRHTVAAAPSAKTLEEHEARCADIDEVDRLYESTLFQTMRYSFLVMIHAFAETQLREFCREIKNERHTPVGATELKGSAIDRVHTFLTKLAGVPQEGFPKVEWERLCALQLIRNCVVHAYGRVEDSRNEKDLRKLVAETSGVSIDHQGRLQFEKSFCELQVVNVGKLFARLFEAVGWA